MTNYISLSAVTIDTMSIPPQSPCLNLEASGFDAQVAAEQTWQALLGAGVFVEGDFTFASGLQATIKVDAERLYSHPEQLDVILGYFATFPCVRVADALLYVPNGMRKFVTLLGDELGIPVVATNKKPGATSKYEFVFASEADAVLATSAQRPVICEDVVTTLGSVAGIRALLRPKQDVHSLTILLRGTALPEYKVGLTDHYLLQREIPTDKYEFRRRLQEEWL